MKLLTNFERILNDACKPLLGGHRANDLSTISEYVDKRHIQQLNQWVEYRKTPCFDTPKATTLTLIKSTTYRRVFNGVAGFILALSACSAHAESWFRFEAGLGAQVSRSDGDGVWQQWGVAQSSEQTYSPAYTVGFTGDIGQHVGWHADYVYFGPVSASCVCVPDSAYNPKTHVAAEAGYIPFSGFGHTQGAAVTLEAHKAFGRFRYGIELGPWFYWATWHESRFDPAYPTETNLSHRTQFQLGAVAGVRIEDGRFALSYRYFYARQLWNPYPAFLTGTHMLSLIYRF